jgi:hypothetical protein
VQRPLRKVTRIYREGGEEAVESWARRKRVEAKGMKERTQALSLHAMH